MVVQSSCYPSPGTHSCQQRATVGESIKVLESNSHSVKLSRLRSYRVMFHLESNGYVVRE
jgi:hypothetical protein